MGGGICLVLGVGTAEEGVGRSFLMCIFPYIFIEIIKTKILLTMFYILIYSQYILSLDSPLYILNNLYNPYIYIPITL